MSVIFGNECRLLTPLQGWIQILFNPTADAVGYCLSPLPGLSVTLRVIP